MRISDWSSDVCSSDLLGGEALRVVEIQVHAVDDGDAAGAGRQDAEAEAGQHRQALRRMGGLQVLHEVGGAHNQAGDARRGRSEEHTSELQSLMRISYAVFCL